MADLLTRMRGSLRQADLLVPGGRIVVGVSGGPDSMGLLHLLVSLNQADDLGWGLRAAHVNHGIRGEEADLDAQLVESYCGQLGVAFSRATVDVPALAAAGRGSLEEVGRNERYAFFERAARECGATRVAVAHHADDNAETILHRVLRGTGLRGLGGIPASRPIRAESDIILVRPLLWCRRDELRAYVEQNGVPFRLDRTNAEVSSTRSRIRNELLPLLRSHYNPGVVDAVLRLGRQAADAHAHLSEIADRQFEDLMIARDATRVRLDARRLARHPPAVQSEVLRQAMADLATSLRSVGYEQVEALRDLAAAEADAGAVDLPGGLHAWTDHGQLVIARRDSPAPADPVPEPVPVDVPGETAAPALGIVVTARIEPVGDRRPADLASHDDRAVEWLDADAVQPPVVLRTRRPGDRFHPLGAPGSMKLSDFFINEKVPAWQRDRVPVLCDQVGLIWVAKLRIAERVRVRSTTRRILRMEILAHDP